MSNHKGQIRETKGTGLNFAQIYIAFPVNIIWCASTCLVMFQICNLCFIALKGGEHLKISSLRLFSTCKLREESSSPTPTTVMTVLQPVHNIFNIKCF